MPLQRAVALFLAVLAAPILLFGCSVGSDAPSPTLPAAEFAVAFSPTPSPTAEPEPAAASSYAEFGFVSVEESTSNIVVESRYFSEYNFVGERIDGYESTDVLLTEEAAEALQKAADLLNADGYMLKVYDGYRPQRAVDFLFHWAKDASDLRMKASFYPNLDKADLIARGYIEQKSAHSRGSAVNVTLILADTFEELDMGSPYDYMDAISEPGSTNITPGQAANRELLKKAMEQSGFLSCDQNWWHYTLKNEPYPRTYFDFPVE